MRKYLILAIILLILNSFLASAITASIGNSRMVLRPAYGETIEKSILVKNVNNVKVDIELSASGDLADSIKIKDDKFSLQPNEEKKAYFTIKASEKGTSESKIMVKFTPEEGNGVVLTSTIIIITAGTSLPTEEEKSEDDSGVSVSPGVNENTNQDSNSKIAFSPMMILGLSTLVLFIILFVLVLYTTKSKKKKRGKEVHE